MVSFDFFSQPQGPQIDVNLFPNSASKGVQAGNAQKTVAENIVSGVKSGMDLYQEYQQIQQTQQKIERGPEELRQLQLENQIKETQAQILTDTQDLQLEATKAKLEEQAVELRNKKDLITKKNVFQEQFAQADPLTQKKMIFSGQFNDVFADDPDILSNASNTVRRFLTPDEQIGIDTATKRATAGLQLQREQQRNFQNYQKLKEQYDQDPSVLEAAEKSGLVPEDVVNKARLVHHGKYEMTDEGLIESTDFDPLKTGGRYDIIVGNKIVAEGAPSDTYKLFYQYKNAKNLYDGTYASRVNRQIDNTAAQQKSRATQNQVQRAQATPQGDSTNFAPSPDLESDVQGPIKPNPGVVSQVYRIPLQTREGGINLANNPQAQKSVQVALGLPNDDFKVIKPKVTEFLGTLEEPPQGYFGRLSGDQVQRLADSAQLISFYAAGKQYDELSDEEKADYSDARVKAHNDSVKEFWDSPKGFGPSSMPPDVYKLSEVNSPKELYTLYNMGSYLSLMDALAKQYTAQVSNTKQAILKSSSLSKTLMDRTLKAQGK